MVEVSSEIKLEVARIAKDFGKGVAIEIGCSLLQEKTGFSRVVCIRAVKSILRKFEERKN